MDSHTHTHVYTQKDPYHIERNLTVSLNIDGFPIFEHTVHSHYFLLVTTSRTPSPLTELFGSPPPPSLS